MTPPQLWLLAGANGAGKSTFYRLYLKPRGLPFVNADIIARHLFPENPEQLSYAAAQEAEYARNRYLQEQRSFCFETVFSHPSKIDFLGQAKGLGYEITLVFIHLNLPSLNQARVAQRVSEGGHSVPADKIDSRIPRTLNHVKAALPLADRVEVLDNSRQDQPFQRVFSRQPGNLQIHCEPLPEWASWLLAP
jgi:predicted ABC-type ATPase